MENNTQPIHPAKAVFLFLLYFVGGLFVAQFIGMLALFPWMGKEVMNLGNIIAQPSLYPEAQPILLFMQGCVSFVSMVICPFFFLWMHPTSPKLHFLTDVPKELFFLATVVLVIASLPLIGYIADFNQQMEFPTWMQGFEQWAMEKEQELKVLTEFITKFDNSTDLFFGLIVIALIPAVGEELVFRGIIQTQLEKWCNNKHLAIWVAAIVFSAIHFQFYGFVPRVLLGVLFGYLFVWTGNMLIPMTAHFTNNAFTLLILHLKNQNKITIDVETSKDIPLSFVLGSAVFFSGLMYLFYLQAKANLRKEVN